VELAFSSQTTARLTGITLGQLTHWGLTDIALPSIDRGRKQGRPKKWSFSDVVGLRVIRELLAAGLSLQLVRATATSTCIRSGSKKQGQTEAARGATKG
jgi:hypothetical protein